MSDIQRADIQEVFYTEEQLSTRVREVAAEISRDYAGREPLLVSVLKGSFIFMADLVRALDLRCTIDFMVVSSYGAGTRTSGAVQILKDLSVDVSGKDVILVEDILDSGLTLSYLRDYLRARGVGSISICTLLDKPSRRTADISADYVGFAVEDQFIVGYGLDYAEKYRNLPYIGVLRPELYGGKNS